jgi:hypothetical protein
MLVVAALAAEAASVGGLFPDQQRAVLSHAVSATMIALGRKIKPAPVGTDYL